MKIYFDARIDGRVQIEVDGSSREECLENLRKMTLADLQESGDVTFDLLDIDQQLVSESVIVEVKDVVYATPDEDWTDYNGRSFSELPTEYTFEIEDITDIADISDAIEECIFAETWLSVDDFRYTVIKES